MNELNVKSGILSIVDGLNVSIASTKELDLSVPETYAYIAKCLAKVIDDPTIKKAEFFEDSNFLKELIKFRDEKTEQKALVSYIVAKLDTIMKNELKIPACDLLCGIVNINGKDFLYLLKLNHHTRFTHIVQNNDGVFVDLIRHKAILPPSGGKADEFAIVSLNDFTLQVIEKTYKLTDGYRCYFAADLLESKPSHSTVEILKALDNAVSQSNDNLNESQFDIMPSLKNVLLQKSENNEDVILDELIEEVFAQNADARAAVHEELVKSGIPQTVHIREAQAQKVLSKQKIHTDIGIDLNIPIALYNDPNIVEFINNPDGTISILIKGIGKLVNKQFYK